MKRSFFRQIGLLLLLNLGLIFGVLGSETRFELQTQNFTLAGESSESEIKAAAVKLENFQRVFRRLFKQNRIETPFPTRVIVLQDRSEQNFYQNQTFLSANDVNYAVLVVNDPESWANFVTDYTKFLLANNVGRNNLPAWLFEGLAEHFRTLKISNEHHLEFENSAGNDNILRNSRLIPIDVVLETDHFTLRNQPDERKQIFRAQAWALLRYLLKDAGDLARIEKFIEFKKQGIDNSKATSEAFQINPAQLKEHFPNFSETGKIESLPITLSEKISGENTWPTVPISQSKWLALQADFLFYANRFKEAEILIEKSRQLDPRQSLALTTLALLKARTFYYDEAEKLAEKAIEIEPDNFLNHYRYALALAKRGMTEYGFVSGYTGPLAQQMREALRQSIELNPNFMASYALLVFVNGVRNEAADESIDLINKALKIAPGNHQYQLRLAEINLRKEKFSEARRLTLRVLQNTESDGVRLFAQNTIQRIDGTEYQLERIRNRNAKYVDDELVTEKPLSEEEIRKLREKATNEQIRAVLRLPGVDEKRVFGSLAKIECGRNRVDFLFRTQTGLQKFFSSSLDGVRLLSLVEEMSDYRLNCGGTIKENNAAVIFKNAGEIISIEFVPRGFN